MFNDLGFILHEFEYIYICDDWRSGHGYSFSIHHDRNETEKKQKQTDITEFSTLLSILSSVYRSCSFYNLFLITSSRVHFCK